MDSSNQRRGARIIMPILPAVNYPINCGYANLTTNNNFTKRSISEKSFDLIFTPAERITNFANESMINIDKNGSTIGIPLKYILRRTGSSFVTDYLVSTYIRAVGYYQNILITSESTNILSNLSLDGISTHQSDGDALFKAISDDGETILARVKSYSQTPAVTDTFLSWSNGSLAKHCTDQIDGLIANKTELNLYTDYQFYGNQITNTFQRNPNCWANGVDLSCASPWNIPAPGDESGGGAIKAGTLISPRHVIFANHFYALNGTIMVFIASNGEKILRTITNSIRIGTTDIRIAILDSDVPNTIAFAKVLPSNWSNYLPGLNSISNIPVMCLNQTEKASIASLYALDSSFVNTYPTQYSSYFNNMITNDSGNPVFLIINGEPVIIGVFYSGGAGYGSFISYNYDAINSAMSSLGGVYQLTPANLSQFNNYG